MGRRQFMSFSDFQLQERQYTEQHRLGLSDEQYDRYKTGRHRCIGCGKFLKNNATWNQCADCDDRFWL